MAPCRWCVALQAGGQDDLCRENTKMRWDVSVRWGLIVLLGAALAACEYQPNPMRRSPDYDPGLRIDDVLDEAVTPITVPLVVSYDEYPDATLSIRNAGYFFKQRVLRTRTSGSADYSEEFRTTFSMQPAGDHLEVSATFSPVTALVEGEPVDVLSPPPYRLSISRWGEPVELWVRYEDGANSSTPGQKVTYPPAPDVMLPRFPEDGIRTGDVLPMVLHGGSDPRIGGEFKVLGSSRYKGVEVVVLQLFVGVDDIGTTFWFDAISVHDRANGRLLYQVSKTWCDTPQFSCHLDGVAEADF